MNKIINITILLIAGLICSPTVAMKLPEAPSKDPAKIIVINRTPEKIEVEYIRNDKRFTSTLVKDQQLMIKDFHSLEKLYIEPYGKVKGWMSLSALSGGLLKSNLLKSKIGDVNLEFAQLNNRSVEITVKLGGEKLSQVVGKVFAGALSPYQYSAKIIDPEKLIEVKLIALKSIFDYFPQVKDAIFKSQEVKARYFLNVGEGASSEDIDEAFEREREEWSLKKDSENVDEADLAKKVLEFLEEAYKDLQGIPNIFTSLVEELVAQRLYMVPSEEILQPMSQKGQPRTLTEEEKAFTEEVRQAFSGELSDSE